MGSQRWGPPRIGPQGGNSKDGDTEVGDPNNGDPGTGMLLGGDFFFFPYLREKSRFWGAKP